MLSKKTVEEILELQKKYPQKRSALIPALHLAQNEVGYLPPEIQNEIASLFELSPNDVHGIVTFYDMFFENPVGNEMIHVCKNVSCMLRGADGLIEAICKKLNITSNETSDDGKYTLIRSECLGACDKAPMMIVGEKVVGPVKEGDLGELFHG